jgi:archaellum component FlaF (FlaF/FlaG flagellin family)
VSAPTLIVCSDWWNDTEGNKNTVSDKMRVLIPGIVVSGLVNIDYFIGMNSFSVRVAK